MMGLTSASAVVDCYNNRWPGCELIRLVQIETSARGIAAEVGGDLGEGSSGYSGDSDNAIE